MPTVLSHGFPACCATETNAFAFVMGQYMMQTKGFKTGCVLCKDFLEKRSVCTADRTWNLNNLTSSLYKQG